MGTRFAIFVICTSVALAAADHATAQTVPEGQSCGGLLCDLGVFGHKTAPVEAALPPAQNLAAVPPAAASVPAVAPEPLGSPAKKKVAHKKKPVAKVAAVPAPAPAAPVAAASVDATATAAPAIASPLAAPPRPAPFLFRPIYQ